MRTYGSARRCGRNALYILCCVVPGAGVWAQERLPDLTHRCCSYYGEDLPEQLYSFSSDEEAQGVMKSILRKTGLEPNFRIMAANVPNAAATVIGEERVILYNQAFMHRIKVATKTDWSGISILAHEVGHHLQGHTLAKEGSNHKDELEADKYSGWVVAKMGATLEEAHIAIATFTTEAGSKTHPPRSARLAAITNGWKQARSDGEVKPASVGVQNPQPQPQQGESLSDWFERFWAHQKVNSATDWVADFDDFVDYCYHDQGLARRSVLMESRRELIEKYPTRSYRTISTPTYVEFGSGEKLATLHFAYDYVRFDGKKVAGVSHLGLILRRKGAEGKWVIAGYDETVKSDKSAVTKGTGTPSDIGETAQESLAAFLNAHVSTMNGNDAGKWAGMFAPNAHYCYSDGPASRSFLKEDRAKLINRYPERTYGRLGTPSVEVLEGGKRARLTFEVSYFYRSPSGRIAKGITKEMLGLRWDFDRWLITRYEEEVVRQ